MTNVTFFCHACHAYRAVEIEPVSADDLNPEPWGDIVCAVCGFVIATISGPPGVYRVVRVGDIRPDYMEVGMTRTWVTGVLSDTAELWHKLTWALDLIDLYDQRLAAIDDPAQVYSDTHNDAKAAGRDLLHRTSAHGGTVAPTGGSNLNEMDTLLKVALHYVECYALRNPTSGADYAARELRRAINEAAE